MIGCPVAWKCLVACRLGELSQQPTQATAPPRTAAARTQVPPVARQSWQPGWFALSMRIWSRWVQSSAMGGTPARMRVVDVTGANNRRGRLAFRQADGAGRPTGLGKGMPPPATTRRTGWSSSSRRRAQPSGPSWPQGLGQLVGAPFDRSRAARPASVRAPAASSQPRGRSRAAARPLRLGPPAVLAQEARGAAGAGGNDVRLAGSDGVASRAATWPSPRSSRTGWQRATGPGGARRARPARRGPRTAGARRGPPSLARRVRVAASASSGDPSPRAAAAARPATASRASSTLAGARTPRRRGWRGGPCGGGSCRRWPLRPRRGPRPCGGAGGEVAHPAAAQAGASVAARVSGAK